MNLQASSQLAPEDNVTSPMEKPQTATVWTYLNSRGFKPAPCHVMSTSHSHWHHIALHSEPLSNEPTSVPYLKNTRPISEFFKKDASSTQTVICLTWKQNVGERRCCGQPDGWLFTSALNSADFGSIPSSSRKCFTARGFHFWESVSLAWPWPKSFSPSTNKLFLLPYV